MDQSKKEQQEIQLLTIDETSCLGKLGIPDKSIILYYTEEDWCMPCKAAKEITDKHTGTIRMHYAEESSGDGMEAIDCFDLEPGVPQFICTNSGEIKSGSLSETNFLKFANECIE